MFKGLTTFLGERSGESQSDGIEKDGITKQTERGHDLSIMIKQS